MCDIIIRSLEEKDCDAVALVAEACLPEPFHSDMARDVLCYDHNHFFVACDGDNVVAFAGMMQIVDEAELLYIAVSEEFRRKHIGQRLFDRICVQAGRGKARRILLEVRHSNENALAFYEKNGFVRMGVRRDYYSNPKEDAIIMEKTLS